jgi:hypothetical protein
MEIGGSQTDNAFNESFNRTLRDESLEYRAQWSKRRSKFIKSLVQNSGPIQRDRIHFSAETAPWELGNTNATRNSMVR